MLNHKFRELKCIHISIYKNNSHFSEIILSTNFLRLPKDLWLKNWLTGYACGTLFIEGFPQVSQTLSGIFKFTIQRLAWHRHILNQILFLVTLCYSGVYLGMFNKPEESANEATMFVRIPFAMKTIWKLFSKQLFHLNKTG